MKNKRTSKANKGGLYIALSCFALIAAVIGYIGSNNTDTKKDNNTEKTNIDEIATASAPTPNNSLKGKVVVEVKDEETPKKISDEKPITQANAVEEDVAVSKNVELLKPEFSYPVKGKIKAGFSGDKLIYNEILSDWRTHNGVDILCDENAAICASSDGIVSEVYESGQGKSVKIDHQNGYMTIYANLSDQLEVISGDSVKAGDIIAKVGNSSVSDFTQEPHLHFEILLNDQYVNPEELIK